MEAYCLVEVSSHRFPRFPPKNLCSLVMLAVSSLIFAATDTAFYKVLISLGLAESRILRAAPVDTRPRTPLISFCTVQLRTLCAAHSLATLCLSTTSGPNPRELAGFWGSMVFRHASIPRKGSNNQQQKQQVLTSTSSKIYNFPRRCVDSKSYENISNNRLENLTV